MKYISIISFVFFIFTFSLIFLNNKLRAVKLLKIKYKKFWKRKEKNNNYKKPLI